MKKFFTRAGFLLLMAACVVYGFAFERYNVFPRNQLRSLHRLVRSAPEPAPPPGPDRYGRWGLSRRSLPDSLREAALEEFGTLPYLQGYNAGVDTGGVVTYNERSASDGATLYCSGHAPVVYLIDMSGELLHSWAIRYEEVWPDSVPFPIVKEHTQFIRRAHVYPDGDLLCVFEYIGLVRLDKDSHIQWRHTGQNHHDVRVTRRGNIYTLGRTHREIPSEIPDSPLERGYNSDDLVTILKPDGSVTATFSVFDAFYHSDYASYLNFITDEYDLFHANSIDVIEAPVPRGGLFEVGDILISMRSIHTIALIDGSSHRVKWALAGKWRAQHQAVVLENGNILLLDNQGANNESYFAFNRSKVVEIDPLTQEIEWEYSPGEESGRVLFTRWLGYNQRLPNGNTLITESDQGHILEVTRRGRVVWEYFNPNRVGKHGEYIATIMGATRIDRKKLRFLRER